MKTRLVEIKFKNSTTDVTDATDKKKIGNTSSEISANRAENSDDSSSPIRSIRSIRGSKLIFSYDGNGRRVSKKVFDSKGELVSDTRFLYSGFKCVAELDALKKRVIRFYQWQGEQLLGVVDVKSGKQLACLTDGNKNVIGLIDNSGAITARYTYSPFGKLISAKGADAPSCSFGFSCEYRDSESGLVYYNYRYLNPKLGRWMTRDPIRNLGGYNLYALVLNSSPNKWDYLGLVATGQIWHEEEVHDSLLFGVWTRIVTYVWSLSDPMDKWIKVASLESNNCSGTTSVTDTLSFSLSTGKSVTLSTSMNSTQAQELGLSTNGISVSVREEAQQASGESYNTEEGTTVNVSRQVTVAKCSCYKAKVLQKVKESTFRGLGAIHWTSNSWYGGEHQTAVADWTDDITIREKRQDYKIVSLPCSCN